MAKLVETFVCVTWVTSPLSVPAQVEQHNERDANMNIEIEEWVEGFVVTVKDLGREIVKESEIFETREEAESCLDKWNK